MLKTKDKENLYAMQVALNSALHAASGKQIICRMLGEHAKEVVKSIGAVMKIDDAMKSSGKIAVMRRPKRDYWYFYFILLCVTLSAFIGGVLGTSQFMIDVWIWLLMKGF